MKIKTKEVSGIASALIDMRKPMKSKNDSVFGTNPDWTIYLVKMGDDDKRLAKQLASCKGGSGHDSFLKDIVVHADFTATADFIMQLYRYHYRDTASSESKMHGITKVQNIGDNCSKWVDVDIIKRVNALITLHNTAPVEEYSGYGVFFPKGRDYPKTKEEMFECIVHNTPLGYQLTFGEVTNYLQLKSQYKQRKNHKMSSWSTVFTEWVKTLPYSFLITGEDE